MGRQLLLTILTAGILCGLALGYRTFLNPMIAPPTLAVNREIPQNRLPEQTGPKEHRDLAAKYFSHVPWTNKTPNEHHAIADRCVIFTDNWKPDEERKSVTIAPFAMVLFNKDRSKRPVTLTCKSAYVEFNEALDKFASNPIRPVKAQLQGMVHVEGADGLSWKGQTLVYSEEAMTIVCDDQNIEFTYAGSHGTANGLSVELSKTRNGQPSSSLSDIEVEKIRLRQDVELTYQPEEEEVETVDSKPKEPVYISSNGGLEFDLKTMLVTMRDNIRVRQGFDPEEAVGCICDLVTMQLQKITENSENPEASATLELENLAAFGSEEVPLKLYSGKEAVSVNAEKLVYRSKEKAVFLGSRQVTISQRENLFQCQELKIEHNDENEIVSMTCLGKGQYQQLDFKTGQTVIIGNWEDHALYTRLPQTGQDQITLKGKAHFHSVATSPSDVEQVRRIDLSRSMSARAETIDVWLQREESEENGRTKTRVRPVKLIATENVMMQANQTDAKVDKLLVHFQPVVMSPISTTVDPREPESEIESPEELSKLEDPLHINANQMQVWLGQEVNQAGKAKYAFEQAEIAGEVQIQQVKAKSGEQVRIEGDYITLHNQAEQDQQIIAVYGQPAMLQGNQFTIQGNNFQVDRAKDLAWVNGPGRLSLPMKEGEWLEKPDTLTISWTEKMSFQNNQATFLGVVSAKTQERINRLDCRQMTVDFTEAISFDTSNSNKRPDIKSIECKGEVRIHGEEFDETGLKEIRDARFYSLTIEPKSGRTHAQGPGVIEIWSRNDKNENKAGFGREVSVVANRSLSSPKSDWHYVNVQFQRESIGNISQQNNRFTGGVGIIYGPVKTTSERVDRDHLNKSSGWLRSEELVIEGRKNPKTKKTSIEIIAQGNARIESLKFHATADKITYDQARNEYVFRSLGEHDVSLYQQDRVGGEFKQHVAQTISFNPETHQFSTGGAKGIEGGE